jgi:hypothetical protein
MVLGAVDILDGDTVPVVQFLQKESLDRSDLYIPMHTIYTDAATFLSATEGALASVHEYKNWQYWDTGYRDQMSSNKKRYRELQFKFNNISVTSLDFYTEFFLDGEQRYSMFEYSVHHETDPLSAEYGLITIERTLIDPTILPGETILGESETEYNHWALDTSGFPEMRLWKIRMNVSGKGYTPRMKFISQNEVGYEILNMMWIYRLMNAR